MKVRMHSTRFMFSMQTMPFWESADLSEAEWSVEWSVD